MNSIQWLKVFAASSMAAAGFSWLFVESFKRMLDRSVQRSLESYKTELQLQAQSQLERHKAELQVQTSHQVEAIKHEMQKQILRAQLSTTKTQEVYSKLIKKIRQAEGSVVGLWGLSREQTFEKHSVQDIAKLLEEIRAPGEDQREILALLEQDRETAIAKLRTLVRRKKIHNAFIDFTRAKNYLVSESIFLTKPVRDLAFEICEHLWKAYASVEVYEDTRGMGPVDIDFHGEYIKGRNHAETLLQNLEEAMRADLLPGNIGDLIGST